MLKQVRPKWWTTLAKDNYADLENKQLMIFDEFDNLLVET